MFLGCFWDLPSNPLNKFWVKIVKNRPFLDLFGPPILDPPKTLILDPQKTQKNALFWQIPNFPLESSIFLKNTIFDQIEDSKGNFDPQKFTWKSYISFFDFMCACPSKKMSKNRKKPSMGLKFSSMGLKKSGNSIKIGRKFRVPTLIIRFARDVCLTITLTQVT